MAAPDPRDPRTDEERAMADLKRNSELGLAIPESPIEERPVVTPETFGEHRNVEVERGPVGREEGDDPLPEAP